MGTRKEQGNARLIDMSREAILKGIRQSPMVVVVRQEKLQKTINIQSLRNSSPIYVFRRQKP
jgi:hypothetical protein